MLAHTTDELLMQFHHNQSVWIARLATGEIPAPPSHARLFQVGETAAMRPGSSGVLMLPFAGQLPDVLAQHQQALTWLRQNRVHDVLVWSMRADAALDLAMLAQGYVASFEPWWMSRDLTQSIPPPTHRISLANNRDIDTLIGSDIPYVMRDQLETTRLLVANGHRDVIWLMAHMDDHVVGQAIVNLTGMHAGLFNVGVSGRYRHRGIGTSLSLAAMQVARDRGAMVMNLNSTPMGKPIYERSGFSAVGVGQTWVRAGIAVSAESHPDLQRKIIALGQGNIAALAGDHIPAILPNRMTAQELAARFGRQDSLYHLIEAGHVPEIMSLWNAGLKEEAMAAASNPAARELITGSRGARPIHLAVERGAGSLVLALIAAGADLNARDDEYRATPLDWAHACNKPTIARILQRAGGR